MSACCCLLLLVVFTSYLNPFWGLIPSPHIGLVWASTLNGARGVSFIYKPVNSSVMIEITRAFSYAKCKRQTNIILNQAHLLCWASLTLLSATVRWVFFVHISSYSCIIHLQILIHLSLTTLWCSYYFEFHFKCEDTLGREMKIVSKATWLGKIPLGFIYVAWFQSLKAGCNL